MTTVTREVWINAPVEEVWALLADFGNIYLFNPNVPKSYLTSSQQQGVGTTRHCDLNVAGASIEERIVDWQEGKSMTIDIYEGKKSPPFKTALATIRVASEKGGTKVTGTLEYKMKFGPVGSLMDVAMVKPQFGKAWSLLFAGLKHYAETGEEINGETRSCHAVVTNGRYPPITHQGKHNSQSR